MITAREHVEQLAEVTGFDESEFRTVDKYLADAGFRRKTSGRAFVQISRRESLLILLGVMGAPVKSRPEEYVEDVQKFTKYNIRCHDGSDDALSGLIGVSADELDKLPLIDVLERMAGTLAGKWPDPKGGFMGARVWIEVEMNGPVEIHVDSEDFRGEIAFMGVLEHRNGDGRRVATVSNSTLAWIGHNTETE